MDSSKKPEKKNPRKNANFLSQLLFCWIIPLMFKGCRKGLHTDDLTKQLEKDNSEKLGNKLELEWEKELRNSRRKNHTPKLKNALFRTFISACIFDGILVFLFVLLKSLLPVVLGQLLLQFELHRTTPNATFTTVTPIFSTPTESPADFTTLPNLNYSDDTLLNRLRRNLPENDDKINLNSPFDNEQANKTANSAKQVFSEIDGLLETTTVTVVAAQAAIHEDVLEWFRHVWQDITEFINYAWWDVRWLSSLLILMILITCFLTHHSDLRQRMVGARMRIACCSLIYRKTLKMSKKAAGQTAAGYLVNLLSNDVSRLDYGFIYMHYVWVLPLQSVLICYLLWLDVGFPALIGVIGLLLKTIPVQTGLSRVSSILRMRVATRTDQRVGIMNEIIQGIQVIKMYAWEKPFRVVVAMARKKEVTQIKWASYIRGIYLSTMVFTERSTLFITLAACVWYGDRITADVVFSMAQFFNILQLTAAIFYPLAVSLGAEALVSITRVQNFLLMEDQDTTSQGLHCNEIEIVETKSTAIELINITATWEDYKHRTLENVNLKVKAGELCAIIGDVGAGKSSLLQLLLGELPIYSGDAIVNGEISYGSQEPWLFTGTVRHNILFGQEYDKKRYHDVVKHCALLTDFEQLPEGDRTLVGERGTSLSGGQRARVSLARAVYKNASIYLLDDPLSAVDAHVGRHLFDECIGPFGYLATQKATRVLVTHQVHFLKDADWIVIMENGRIMQQGTYKDLMNSELDFAKLLERPCEESDGEEDRLEDYDEDEIPFMDGLTADGYMPIRRKSSMARSKSGSGSKLSSSVDGVEDDDRVVAEEQADGSVSLRVWISYFRSGGNVCLLVFLFLVLVISQCIISGSDYFVSFWTNQEDKRMNNVPTMFTTMECLYIYGGLIIGVVLITVLRGYLFFKVCMKASRTLHNKMFACLLGAPMRFFDTNPSGRILNRFSKDMGAIDELLPKAMMESIQILLVMVGILAMVTVVNPLLLIPLAVAILIFIGILKLYLTPAQDLKRLEGITRSPVFSHLSATLHGLSTIRVNNAQNRICEEFDQLQDVHSAVWQLTMSSNAALGLWLDCVSTAFVAAVTFSFIMLHESNVFSGNVGLAISQAMILTGMVQYGIRQTTESIQQMTCVERVLQYTELDQEPPILKKPPSDWPWKAQIEFQNMSLYYDLNGLPTIKNLDIKIRPAWKVGIVGRTGAGKSSLIAAIFRLAHIEGKILIDGMDTAAISLEGLRSKISIIPQDPVLFSATMRYNLDPFNIYNDDELWRALEEVELKSSVDGLEFMITEGGSNFSVGQRQLICLARAILRNNKVLVLDEATANVDPRTDALIQRTIRVKFKDCTVLTVAHRLHTVMDSDRILVMESGYAKEFDIPFRLLQKPTGGLLLNMVEACGAEAESLKRIATETYEKMDEQTKYNGKLWGYKK